MVYLIYEKKIIFICFIGCQENEFTCASGECISATLYCDGRKNCYDGSDEYNCPSTTQAPTQPPYCGSGQWQCRSGECIPHSSRCDNRYDCNDYSDETDCCK